VQPLAGDAPFVLVARPPDQLIYATDLLEPGVYVIRYALQPRYGSALAPPPLLQQADMNNHR
jgi:hypothetical protein